MNAHDKYQALLRIQVQLLDWAAYQSNWHYKLHGSKEINECIQLCKKLVAMEAQELLIEEAQKLDFYISSPQSVDSSNLE